MRGPSALPYVAPSPCVRYRNELLALRSPTPTGGFYLQPYSATMPFAYLCRPFLLLAIAVLLLMAPAQGLAQAPPHPSGGEAHLVIPDLSQGTFLGSTGRTLLIGGFGVC